MSVLVAGDTAPADALRGHAGFALAGFTAVFARSLGQAVVLDPLPDAPDHALVRGAKSRATLRAFARQAVWIVPPA